MPLIGDLVAAGKTPTQLKEEITRRFADYVRDPSAVVSVAVLDVQSYHFTVIGNVERAGTFTSRNYVTVSDAIAMAGGLNRFGSPDSIVLVRTWGGKSRRIPIDYTEIQSGTRPEASLVLLPGDTLIVP
jgi:polysaccharide export outer membrane protein